MALTIGTGIILGGGITFEAIFPTLVSAGLQVNLDAAGVTQNWNANRVRFGL